MKSKLTKVTTVLFALLFVLILGQKNTGTIKADCSCQCPNTSKGHEILWGVQMCEPTGTCAVCPGASCSGNCGGGGGGGGGHGGGPPPPPPPPKPYAFTVDPPTSDCIGPNPYVNLTWGNSSNASRYQIYRSDYGWVSGNITSPRNFTDNNVVSGNNYNYIVYAYNNSGSTSINAPSLITAKTCDITTPTVHINWTNSSVCFTPAYWKSSYVQPISIHVDDVHDSTGKSVVSSGISSVYAILHSVESGADSPQYSATVSQNNSDGSFEYQLPNPFQPPFLNTIPAPRNYILTSFATDNASHTGNSQGIQFRYDNACTSPYLKTQGGDVHSNTSIKISGGPTPSP